MHAQLLTFAKWPRFVLCSNLQWRYAQLQMQLFFLLKTWNTLHSCLPRIFASSGPPYSKISTYNVNYDFMVKISRIERIPQKPRKITLLKSTRYLRLLPPRIGQYCNIIATMLYQGMQYQLQYRKHFHMSIISYKQYTLEYFHISQAIFYA